MIKNQTGSVNDLATWSPGLGKLQEIDPAQPGFLLIRDGEHNVRRNQLVFARAQVRMLARRMVCATQTKSQISPRNPGWQTPDAAPPKIDGQYQKRSNRTADRGAAIEKCSGKGALLFGEPF